MVLLCQQSDISAKYLFLFINLAELGLRGGTGGHQSSPMVSCTFSSSQALRDVPLLQNLQFPLLSQYFPWFSMVLASIGINFPLDPLLVQIMLVTS